MGRLRQIQGYDVIATLGTGARSTIYAVRDRTHQIYALKHVIKEQPKDERFLEQAIIEYELSSKLNHPNLRRCYKLIRQRKLFRTVELVVLMEMVDGHTMEQYQPATYVEFCQLCQQVAAGLDAMHVAGFVHADIKPNNILITGQDQVKLIDFGQSCELGTVKKRIQGTPDYIAPEQVKRHKITPLTDVFNLGASMYWMLTGRHVPTMIPKKRDEVVARADKYACVPPAETNDNIPPALSALVMDCVKRKPAERPVSMEVVIERLAMTINQFEQISNEFTPRPGFNRQAV